MASVDGLLTRVARRDDTQPLRAVRIAASDKLTKRYGSGHWSLVTGVSTIQKHIQARTVWVGELSGKLVATLRFTESKVGFYRSSWFSDPEACAGYLMHMAVSPDKQKRGYGTALLREVEAAAINRGLEYMRLDSYDAPAGAGPFYVKAGYNLVHSREINGVPLQYWEKSLG